MPNSLRFGAAAALISLLFAVNGAAQQDSAKPEQDPPPPSVAELEKNAMQAYQDKNWTKLYVNNMKLHQMRPHDPQYLFGIIRAAGALDRRRTAYHFMMKLQQQGLSYDLDSIEETANMRGTEAYEYINNLMSEAGQPAGEGQAFLSIPGRPSDLGDVAWDGSRKRFLVGTRSEGKLLAVDDSGETELLLTADENNGLWSIEGLAVDEKNNALWIASSASPAFSGFSAADTNRGALFHFALDSLEPLRRYNLAVDGLPHSLGSVALADTGDVYVIDRAVPIIYRKAPDSQRLEHFVAAPKLTALTDITVTPDNSRLFVADAIMGILLVDPASTRSALLQGPESLNLYGIYGVDYTAGNLVITQSGISPQRIMRLKLDTAGAAAEAVAPMAIALEGFDTPGVGTLREGSLYYFANHGTQSDENEMRMMVTPLDAGGDIKQPDMKVFEEALRQKAQQQAEDPQ